MDPTALGRYLRETREAKERTLEDAVTTLKIRRAILESFEQGNFAVSESQVQVRGMLRNYARFLGLEEERILEYYAATQSSPTRQRRRFGRVVEEESQLQAPRKITDTQPKPPTILDPPTNRFAWVGGVLRNLALISISLASIAVIVFVIYDTLNLDSGTGEESVLEAGLQTASALPPGTITPTYTTTWTQQPDAATATTDFSLAGIGGVQVNIELQQRSYVRVSVDGVEQFAGVMEPGDQVLYEGNDLIELTAANAPAVLITFNGIEQDILGTRGQEAVWVFSPSGVEVMTGGATLTPMATITPTQTDAPPTAEATAEVTEESAAQADTSIVEENSSALPSPTSIFDNTAVPSATSAGDTSADAAVAATPTTSDGDTNAEIATEEAVAAATTVIPSATIEPTATQTATPAAPLPLRATSGVSTSTKPAPGADS